jgi:Holliday junction resolvase
MGANSRVKGKSGERELCRLLGSIFSGSFVRVPNSGAAVGGKNAAKRQYLSKAQDRSFRGDIIPPDFLPHLVIESKSHRAFRFHQLLRPGRCPLLEGWISQTIDVVDEGDQWFVAFKVTRVGWYVAVPDSSDYQFDNSAVYHGNQGRFRITEMISFFTANRTLIAQKAGPRL